MTKKSFVGPMSFLNISILLKTNSTYLFSPSYWYSRSLCRSILNMKNFLFYWTTSMFQNVPTNCRSWRKLSDNCSHKFMCGDGGTLSWHVKLNGLSDNFIKDWAKPVEWWHQHLHLYILQWYHWWWWRYSYCTCATQLFLRKYCKGSN